MRRICMIFLCLAMVVTVCSCKKSEPVDLQNMTSMETEEYVAVVWNDRVYVSYCATDNYRQGNQIGIIDNDKNYKVYEVKDLSTDEWIITYYNSGLMDGSMLMKEETVTNIPEGFYSEYEWNNK